MGLIKFWTYIVLMINIELIQKLFFGVEGTDSLTVIALGIIAIFSLTQASLGLLTLAIAFHQPFQIPTSREIHVIGCHRHNENFQPSGRSTETKKTELSETFGYIEAKMS